jgi:hypothetical protein
MWRGKHDVPGRTLVSIDVCTGVIAFPRLPLGAHSTRTELLASPLADGAKIVVENDPWWTYGLPVQPLGGREFAVMLSFEGEELRAVYLTDTDPRFGTSWDDYSEEKEQARKRQHDRWLRQSLGRGRPWRFPWGTLDSVYDPRSGSSMIAVDYEPTGEARR